MKIAIAANKHVDPKAVALTLAAALVMIYEEDPKSVVLIRADSGMKPASKVEELAVNLANEIGLAHTSYIPHPVGGRAGVYKRDYRMAEDSDRVLAFFFEGHIMAGGTGHVVHAALQKEVPVEAWEVLEDGTLENIGSDEGYEIDEAMSGWLQSRWDSKTMEQYQANLHMRWDASP